MATANPSPSLSPPLDSASNPEPDAQPPSDPSISSTEETAAEEEAIVEGEEEEEEEEECGFCLFMKGGGCKDPFVAWEKCVEDAEKTGEDVVEKCFEITSLLKKCMDAHADYYEPILRAEKAMADSITSPESDSDAAEVEKEKSRDGDPGEEKSITSAN